MLLEIVDCASCGLHIANRNHQFPVSQHLQNFDSFVRGDASHVLPAQVHTSSTSRQLRLALVLEITAVLMEVRVRV